MTAKGSTSMLSSDDTSTRDRMRRLFNLVFYEKDHEAAEELTRLSVRRGFDREKVEDLMRWMLNGMKWERPETPRPKPEGLLRRILRKIVG